MHFTITEQLRTNQIKTVKGGEKMATKTKKKGFIASMMNNGSMDIPFLIILMTIVTLGLIMLFSASYTYSYYNRGHNSTAIFSRQVVYAVIGIVFMLIISRIKYEYFRLAAVIGIWVSIALLVVVRFLPDSVQPGFYRWIDLGFITFQPSEIAKLGLVMYFAYSLEKHYKVVVGKVPSDLRVCRFVEDVTNGKVVVYKSFISTLQYGFVIVLFAGLVLIENHVSGAVLMLALGVIMLFLGEVKNKWFIVGVIVAAIGVLFFVLNPDVLKEYAGERIVAWLDKDYEPLGARWQTNNSLYAIGSGGFLGVGLGQSKQKHLYVSEPHNDFIFSIVCEELGFVGAAIIIILFALLVYRGIKIGLRAKDRFSGLLAMGIVFQIGVQVALNIAVVSDFIPNTGISLPFFSAGGTSLVILLCEMGVVLSISRSARKKE